jgi:hypothetical protein
VRDELAWACQALEAADRPMRAVAPLRVGNLAKKKHPAAIAKFNLYVADLLSPSDLDWGIDRLIRDLCAQLNRQPPLVIPATVIAMDATRCDELLKDVSSCTAHFDACEALGMTCKPGDLDRLRKRYGTDSFALRPFADERTIRDHLRRTENSLNALGILPNDTGTHAKPNSIHFKLIDPNLLISNDPALQFARDVWRSTRHLIIIDSFSLLDQALEQLLANILQLAGDDRRALLCLPPYTRHTASIPQLLKRTVELKSCLGIKLAWDDWSNKLEHEIAFDIASEPALHRWLLAALSQLAGPSRPRRDAVLAMHGAHESAMRTPGIQPAASYAPRTP